MSEKGIDPRSFMQSRRPELFSDSYVVEELEIDEKMLEYHLSVLTNRKQELEFEHFCHRIAEKEVCPNLIPQTGPIGGGDGKTDSETHPVAELISERWYEGDPTAGDERWAFAFSTKKTWSSKVRDDVKNILNSGIEYKRIFFISNQYIRNKTRKKREKSLTSEFGIPISIFDLTWLVRKVVDKDYAAIANATLHLNLPTRSNSITGPRDIKRRVELDELELRIRDTDIYKNLNYQLVMDCIQAAFLSRTLQEPREIVEAKLDRAVRLARKFDSRDLVLRALYNKAWTMYWWYKGIDCFLELYPEIQDIIDGTDSSNETEKLMNLWHVLKIVADSSQSNPDIIKLDDRYACLMKNLDRIAEDDSRPCNALIAKTDIYLLKSTTAENDEERCSMLEMLKKAFHEGSSMLDYPIETYIDIIKDIGIIFGGCSNYIDLQLLAVNILEARTGSKAAGVALLEMAASALDRDDYHTAIILFGKSHAKLAQVESKTELILALSGAGYAYENIGLLWAARAKYITACAIGLDNFKVNGELIQATIRPYLRLVGIELLFGRVPSVIKWIELLALLDSSGTVEELADGNIKEYYCSFDLIMSVLLINTEFSKFRFLCKLPDLLDKLGLVYSRLTLLHLLGHTDMLIAEGSIPDEDIESIEYTFDMVRSKRVTGMQCEAPSFYDVDQITSYSMVLGCKIIMRYDNNPESIFLTETILSVIEAVLATSLNKRVFPMFSEASISVHSSEYISGMPQHRCEDPSSGCFQVIHPIVIRPATVEEQKAFKDWLLEFTLFFATIVFEFPELEAYIRQLLVDESALDRALFLPNIAGFMSRIFGKNYEICNYAWLSSEDLTEYPAQRKAPLYTDTIDISDHNNHLIDCDDLDNKAALIGKEIPGKITHHRSGRLISVINPLRWDQASWKSAIYLSEEKDGDAGPILAFGFGNSTAGRSIFDEWLEKYDHRDVNEDIRISFIKGVDASRPGCYRIFITTNPKLYINACARGEPFIQMGKPLTLISANTAPRDSFIESYRKFGKYYIVPADVNSDTGEVHDIFYKQYIEKRKLFVCEAWSIKPTDPEVMSLNTNEIPIIPDGIENPPYLDSIKLLKGKQKQY